MCNDGNACGAGATRLRHTYEALASLFRRAHVTWFARARELRVGGAALHRVSSRTSYSQLPGAHSPSDIDTRPPSRAEPVLTFHFTRTLVGRARACEWSSEGVGGMMACWAGFEWRTRESATAFVFGETLRMSCWWFFFSNPCRLPCTPFLHGDKDNRNDFFFYFTTQFDGLVLFLSVNNNDSVLILYEKSHLLCAIFIHKL